MLCTCILRYRDTYRYTHTDGQTVLLFSYTFVAKSFLVVNKLYHYFYSLWEVFECFHSSVNRFMHTSKWYKQQDKRIIVLHLLHMPIHMNLNFRSENLPEYKSKILKWRSATRDFIFMFWIIANDCACLMIYLFQECLVNTLNYGILHELLATSGHIKSISKHSL